MLKKGFKKGKKKATSDEKHSRKFRFDIKKTMSTTCIVIFGIVFGLFVLEMIIRILPEDMLKIDFFIQEDKRIFSSTRDYSYKPNCSRTFNGLGPPVVWRFNNYGFRDSSFDENKDSNVYRILFIGDSMVMGLGVDEQDALPQQLEKIIRPETYYNGMKYIEVYNMGLWGSYEGKSYESVLKEVGLKLDPDLVIVGMFEADMLQAAGNQKSHNYYFLRSIPDKLIPYKFNEFLKKNSYLYLFLLTKYYHLVEKTKVDIVDDDSFRDLGLQVINESIASMDKICKDHDIQFMLLGIPGIKVVMGNESTNWPNREGDLRAISEKLGLAYLDLVGGLKKYAYKAELYINDTDTHFSQKGNQFTAELIAEFLNDNALVPQKVSMDDTIK